MAIDVVRASGTFRIGEELEENLVVATIEPTEDGMTALDEAA